MKNKQFNQLAVCGMDAVKALERAHPEAIVRLYFNAERAPQFGGLCKKLAARKAPYNCVKDNGELEKLCGSVHHQGVVAMIREPAVPQLTSDVVARWCADGESVLLLDRVGNANNLGAIVRSAVFFGIWNIVIPLDEAQSSITTSSYRVAQGGMEYISIYTVASIGHLMQDLRGKMVRIGTDVRAKATVGDLARVAGTKPVFLVLGNEEHGISKEVKDNCDCLIRIPGAVIGTDENGNEVTPIESLNVAQAATLFLYEMSKPVTARAARSEHGERGEHTDAD